ncbi:hypothetical protein PNEG_00604 [Pneumocystis murina B123]|uniref:Uncharacterized protein n=1 Tax=Pneumocystis murina (strain B123) TaxID=1069680 RepID=M7NQK2_PNEMU|nr:hypothetical protein PNEG_00604 [Pneumocystis murina B123]EMR11003.1 hypothetical protein PNEG_00604 [Pneumocystis murina B123]
MSKITYMLYFYAKHHSIINRKIECYKFKRYIFTFLKRKVPFQNIKNKRILSEDNLFYRLSESPIENIQKKAKMIKQYAKCPLSGKPVFFECPNCGYPTHHSEIEWKIDDQHEKFCKKLREANEDEHDLHSGRELHEFLLPISQFKDATISFYNWHSFFHTRSFETINSSRSVRHLSKLLTYPLTILSVIHEGSPYNLENGLTIEGLKSLLAIRSVLHAHPGNMHIDSGAFLNMDRALRIFILGARAESTLPRFLWMQGGANLFPNVLFHIYFIGPEASNILDKSKHDSNSDSIVENFSPNLIFSTYSKYYHELHEKGEFGSFDPCFDIFYLPNPAIGNTYPSSWNKTIKYLLETQCAIFITGCSLEDIQRDINFLKKKYENDYDVLLKPIENRFKSIKWDVSILDPRDMIQANAYISGFRGKKYELQLID